MAVASRVAVVYVRTTEDAEPRCASRTPGITVRQGTTLVR